MKDDTEITGPMALYLYASIDSQDANWIVTLADLGPDGSSLELSRGFLKASHRALDHERSLPWLPFHPHDRIEMVAPDEVVEYAIELSPTSNVFKAGHRIRLVITGSDNPRNPGDDIDLGFGHRPWHVARSVTVVHRVHHEPRYPSHLLLPMIPVER